MLELLSSASPTRLGMFLFALAMSSVQLGVLCLMLTPSVAFTSFPAWASVAVVFIAIVGRKIPGSTNRHA